MTRRSTSLDPLFWLLPFLLVWALLAASLPGAKTASGQNSGLELASTAFTLWNPAPRLGLQPSVQNDAAGAPVAAKRGIGVESAAGKVVAEYGPMNKGPLLPDVANTFRSGTYTEMVAQQPTTLYRVYGGEAKQMGGYWTLTPPAGPVQSIIDSALLPKWGNTATNVVKIEVPAGTKYFTGRAASQGGLVGGGNQVVFPPGFRVDPSWIKTP